MHADLYRLGDKRDQFIALERIGAKSVDNLLAGIEASKLALDAAGIRHAGDFAVFGPAAYFAAHDGSTAGLAVTHVGSTAPSVFSDFDDDTAAARVTSVASGQEAPIPVDVTSGDAMRVPTSIEATPGPSAATSPAISWPRVRGRGDLVRTPS